MGFDFIRSRKAFADGELSYAGLVLTIIRKIRSCFFLLASLRIAHFFARLYDNIPHKKGKK